MVRGEIKKMITAIKTEYKIRDIDKSLLIKAKNGNEAAIIKIIDKYKYLIIKYSSMYTIKDHEKNDLIQIGNIAILKAISNFDINKNENSFDSYMITTIKNTYRYLARNNIKYNSESSLNIYIDDNFEIIDLIADEYDFENYIANKDLLIKIKAALSSFSPFERELIKATYFIPRYSLRKFCMEKNISYYKGRQLLNELLERLRNTVI